MMLLQKLNVFQEIYTYLKETTLKLKFTTLVTNHLMLHLPEMDKLLMILLILDTQYLMII
ncbi:hypothetical protein NQ314_016331 [Rhamnusium bicolor]|uniref:Uncharacterized protein n=1 Tax=Rhamnusium bicolor TaxID=1586634 RepID=A0AAV8WWD3_9CUCU|nr:hypothetical protein NQ314_016331 [Rhamnusium bicolor]